MKCFGYDTAAPIYDDRGFLTSWLDSKLKLHFAISIFRKNDYNGLVLKIMCLESHKVCVKKFISSEEFNNLDSTILNSVMTEKFDEYVYNLLITTIYANT